MRLETRAPGKINVCLFLGPPRADGRHELVSVMQSVTLADRLRLEELDGDGGAAPSDLVDCPGVEGPNLVATAIERFRQATRWDGGAVRISIDKRLPVAAGMAGGSADAAAALRLLARAAQIEDPELLHEIAIGLGADVPAQVLPGRVLATGAGEVIERIPGVTRYGVLVVPSESGAQLSTPDVFREADRLGLPRAAQGLQQALDAVRDGLPDLPDALCVNELQPAALSLLPALEDTLRRVQEAGADVAMVSGSGPTVLGLFHDRAAAKAARDAHFPGCKVAKPVGPHGGEVLAA
ncbi:4-(cytidine 5'-diphospho)-2-C-methyl-D-erythritol kinase [Baekduia sp. Peel2402]|uniref:4-(cytidine 5'-diphospho)-2-C-methyl-D-erythritol kinase n=1 Tax=Baekduia sp. Peel2402 TaxID=3458296 RepID=UPI00403EA9F5